MTTIQDHLTYADGRPVTGRVVVSWPAFQTDGLTVAGGMQAFDIVDGAFNVALYSNVSASPIGTYYTAVYELEEGALYTEYWIVPNLAVASLGQVRVGFPVTPSAMISAMQLTSAGASYGQFLGWNGTHWVPMYVTMINVTPNTIALGLTATPAPDIAVSGSPASLGGTLVLNIPDASPTARGVVTTGPQTFGGDKTFNGHTTLAGGVTVAGTVVLPGYVPVSRLINTGHGLSGGGALNADLNLAVVDNTNVQKIHVVANSTLAGTRQSLNLIGGSNVTLTITDNPSMDWVDVIVASTGGGGGAVLPEGTATGDILVWQAVPGPGFWTTLPKGAAGSVLTAGASTIAWTPSGQSLPVGTNAGDLLVWLDTPAPGAWTVLARGSSGKVLTAGTASISWAALPPPVPIGVETGDLLVWNSGSNAWTLLLRGPAGQVLTAGSANISWAAPSVPPATGTGDILIWQSTPSPGSWNVLAKGASGTVLTAGAATVSWVPPPAGQTPWLSDIDGAGFTLKNAGRIGIGTPSPQGPLSLGNPASDVTPRSWANMDQGVFAFYQAQDYPAANNFQRLLDIVAGGSNTGGNIRLITQAGGSAGVAAMTITAAGSVGVGNTAAVLPDTGANNPRMIVGSTAASSPTSQINLAGNQSGAGTTIGSLNCANYAVSASEKRIAAINFGMDSTVDSGWIAAYTWNAGSVAERMRITAAGNVGIRTPTPQTLLHVRKASAGFAPLAGSQIFVENAGGPAYIEAACAAVGDACGYLFSSGGSLTSYIIDISNTLQFVSPARPAVFFIGAGGAERMRITTAGNVGIGVNNPLSLLSVIAAANPSTVATANQITIGETSNNSDYRLNLGFYNDAGASFKGVIQASHGGPANGRLLLQPSGGTVGIGTTNAVDPLTIASLGSGQIRMIQGNYGAFFRNDGGSFYLMFTNSGDQYGGWKSPFPFTVDLASCNITFGASAFVSANLTASGDFAVTGMAKVGANANPFSPGDLGVSRNNAPTTGVVYFGNSGTKYIFQNGTNFDVQIPGGTLTVNGAAIGGGGVAGVNIQFNGGAASGPYQYLNFQNTGSVVWGGSAGGPGNNTMTLNANTTSDARLKQNITPLSGGLSVIGQLRPIRAEWNGLASTKAGQPVLSVIAQELQSVVPDAVHSFWSRLRPEDREDTELLAINPMAIVSHLILAVQQLERRLKALEQGAN